MVQEFSLKDVRKLWEATDTMEGQKVKKKFKQGMKFDDEKPRMDLLSAEALREIAKVMTFGAKKYGDHNWRKGLAWSRVIAAALRHLTSFNAGEDKDKETGLSHLAHAGCCIMFLLEYEKSRKNFDDRYKG